jgi:hypothetical protein
MRLLAGFMWLRLVSSDGLVMNLSWLSKLLLASQSLYSPVLKKALVTVSSGTFTGAEVTGRYPIINIPGRLSTSLSNWRFIDFHLYASGVISFRSPVLRLNIDLCFCTRNAVLAFTLLEQSSFESNHTGNALGVCRIAKQLFLSTRHCPLIPPCLSLRQPKRQVDTAVTLLKSCFGRCSVRISAKAAVILSEAFVKQVLGYLEVTASLFVSFPGSSYKIILPPYSALIVWILIQHN